MTAEIREQELLGALTTTTRAPAVRTCDIVFGRSHIVELRILDERIRDWGLPRYHSEQAAGIDLFACVDTPLALDPQMAAQLVPSGIAIHIGDPGLAAIVVPRSGLGHRGLVTGNLVGVVDGDFSGQILISAWNRNRPGSEPIVINPGDRIAQMLFVPIIRAEFRVVADFSHSSKRGTGGFGSTGQSDVPFGVNADD